MKAIKEKAKELAAEFNSAKIPELGYLEMFSYLSKIGIRYFSIMMCRELRDNFFDIRKEIKNRGRTTIYRQKKEPIHFTRFVDLIVYYENYTKLHKNRKAETLNKLKYDAFRIIFEEKSVITYAQLKSKFLLITKKEIESDELNYLLSQNAIAYNNGYYYLPQKSGEQLIGSDYVEPEFLSPKEEAKRLKEKSKLHDTRIANNFIIEKGLYRIEFNQQKNEFHFDDGTHDENTGGWRTVSPNGNSEAWSLFIDVCGAVNGKPFSCVDDVNDRFTKFNKAIRQSALPGTDLSVDICIEFLKSQGYKGNLQKIIKSEFEL